MDVPLIAAGVIAILGAAVHGGGGEALVVRRLAGEPLPATSFGGPRTTMAMVHATWHLTTFAFLAIGIGLVLAGTVLDGAEARAIAVLGAASFTGFAALVIGLGFANTRTLRSLYRHPAPLALSAVAALAWWGAL